MSYRDEAKAYAHTNQGLGGQPAAIPVPQTIASAISRVDGLNDRLIEIRNHLGKVCEHIGGPFPASGQIGKDNPQPSGAVARLNDSADTAHGYASEIESLLQSMDRALG